MTDHKEKFVTIPYLDWETKYKPLEETNNRLRDELASKDVVVYVKAQSNIMLTAAMGFGFERQPLKIGYISSSGEYYKQPDYERTLETIRSDIEFQVRECRDYKVLNSKQDCDEYQAKIAEILTDLEKSQSKLGSDVRAWEQEKRKHDFEIMRNNDKINKIPRIVRFLFNIKNI
jgi:hypothetical protein